MLKIILVLIVLALITLITLKVKHILKVKNVNQKMEAEKIYSSFPSTLVSICNETIEDIFEGRYNQENTIKQLISFKVARERCLKDGFAFNPVMINQCVKSCLQSKILNQRGKKK